MEERIRSKNLVKSYCITSLAKCSVAEATEDRHLGRKSSTAIAIGRKKDESKVLENVNSKFYVATEVILRFYSYTRSRILI